MTEAGNRVGHESELHRERVDPLVVCEAPKALETVKQTVLGGENAPLGRGRVGASEFGKAEDAFLEDGATMSRARLVFWVGARKGAAALMASLAR
jgi:hypothetical protein